MATPQVQVEEPPGREKIGCRKCGARYHRIDVHIKTAHSMSVDQYHGEYPDASVLSEYAKAALEEKDVESGSRASPGNGEFVFGTARLSVRTAVEDGDEIYIPEHDDGWEPGAQEKEMLEDLALSIEHNGNPLIVGPTGCGKTLLVSQLACAVEQPMRYANLNGEIRSADFLGEKTIDVDPVSGQSTVQWQDGVLPQAMRRGQWLFLDELDSAPPSVMFVLHSVLEPNRRLTLMANEGEVITAHPEFRVVAAANTLGRGDESGLYAGTRILNEAFLDRFDAVIQADYPNEDTEGKILVKRTGIEQDVAMMMVRAGHRIREAAANDEVTCTCSTRRLVAWAHKARLYGDPKRAAAVTIFNKLGRDDRTVVEGIVQRYMGDS
ncbi:hypothetical protein LCGC14_2069190 [marine sediment metagenome]|uniref:AAA+ ATPase domain-containing protein n=1 Tax=marine sediment metagenome TaxID=412755 RepID=A0A0F9EJ18_9ZZZZ